MTRTAERPLDITVYRITGKQLFFKVPDSFCDVTDPVLSAVRQVLAEMGRTDIRVKVRPYLNHLPAALLRGVYHPPRFSSGNMSFPKALSPTNRSLKQPSKKPLEREFRPPNLDFSPTEGSPIEGFVL